MVLEEILTKYEGQEVTAKDMSDYLKWACDYFHDESEVTDPYLTTTIQLDITDARENYQTGYVDEEGASFQGFMTWCLARALCEMKDFSLRRIGEKWYQFDNLPIFTPVAVGGEQRFRDVVLYNTTKQSWVTFAQYYRQRMDNQHAKFRELPYEVWLLCPFIGNLPELHFTSLQLQRAKVRTGRPLFYFGKRIFKEGRLSVPLSITIDHANADFYTLNSLMRYFNTFLEEPI